MERQPSKGSFGTIFVTTIITLILLGGVILFTYFFIIPNSPITDQLIYAGIIKFLPLIIAFIILLVLFIVFPPYIPKDTDIEDEIELDRFTASLYNLPLEEDYTYAYPPLKPVEELPEPVRVVETATLPYPTPEPVSPVVITPAPETPTSVEPKDQLIYVSPKDEVINVEPKDEVAHIEPIDEVAHAEPIEEAVRIELKDEEEYSSAAVLFNDYPYAIERDSVIAELLAPIQATVGEVASIENTFYGRLADELESALEFNYNLTLVRLSGKASSELEMRGIPYQADDGTHYLILPFYSHRESHSILKDFLNDYSQGATLEGLNIGLTSLAGRSIDDDKLLQEVTVAYNLAKERGKFSIISYDDSLVL